MHWELPAFWLRRVRQPRCAKRHGRSRPSSDCVEPAIPPTGRSRARDSRRNGGVIVVAAPGRRPCALWVAARPNMHAAPTVSGRTRPQKRSAPAPMPAQIASGRRPGRAPLRPVTQRSRPRQATLRADVSVRTRTRDVRPPDDSRASTMPGYLAGNSATRPTDPQAESVPTTPSAPRSTPLPISLAFTQRQRRNAVI